MSYKSDAVKLLYMNHIFNLKIEFSDSATFLVDFIFREVFDL